MILLGKNVIFSACGANKGKNFFFFLLEKKNDDFFGLRRDGESKVPAQNMIFLKEI